MYFQLHLLYNKWISKPIRESPICPDFVSLLKSAIPVTSYKKGRGAENLLPFLPSLLKRFSSPLPFLYDVTGIALFKSDTKSGQIGLCHKTQLCGILLYLN